MIEITTHGAGHCQVCETRTAEYSINAGPEEWGQANRVCQPCMIAYLQKSELLRTVLLLQAGAGS